MATIIDDDRFEESPESFMARLSLIPTERVTVIPERTMIQIFDEDCKSNHLGQKHPHILDASQMCRLTFMLRYIMSLLPAVIRIGFQPDTYSVSEGDGVVTLEVAVLEGALDRDLIVKVTTSDGTATCKFES
jgi:hypothetical protein